MHLDGKHHSLSTLGLAPANGGTRLVYTEQIAYLDGTSEIDGTAAASTVWVGIWKIQGMCCAAPQ